MNVSFLKYREKSARMCLYLYMNVLVCVDECVCIQREVCTRMCLYLLINVLVSAHECA